MKVYLWYGVLAELTLNKWAGPWIENGNEQRRAGVCQKWSLTALCQIGGKCYQNGALWLSWVTNASRHMGKSVKNWAPEYGIIFVIDPFPGWAFPSQILTVKNSCRSVSYPMASLAQWLKEGWIRGQALTRAVTDVSLIGILLSLSNVWDDVGKSNIMRTWHQLLEAGHLFCEGVSRVPGKVLALANWQLHRQFAVQFRD